ncbi:MAG: TolC family protein [Rickettsiaceae bacterium]
MRGFVSLNLISCVLLLLTSCNYFYPTFHNPDITYMSKWQRQSSNEVSNLPYLTWWQLLQSNELNELIDNALKNNQKLELAAQNIQIARSQLLTIKLNWLPKLNLLLGHSSGNNDLSVGQMSIPLEGLGSFFAAMPSYTINLFANFQKQKMANHIVKATYAEFLGARLIIIAQTVQTYFVILEQENKLNELNKLESKLKELVVLSQNMETHGMSSYLIINQLESDLLLLKGQIILTNNNITKAKNILRYLLGKEPGELTLRSNFSQIQVDQIIPGNLPVNVISARPDIIAAEQALIATNKSIGLASSALLPAISLRLFYASTDDFHQHFHNRSSSLIWLPSPAVLGMIKHAKASYKAALINYIDIVNQALHQTNNALNTYQAWKDSYQYLFQSVVKITDNVELQEEMKSRGIVSERIVILNEIAQITSTIELSDAKLAALLALTNVYLELGGGYMHNIENIKIKKEIKLND